MHRSMQYWARPKTQSWKSRVPNEESCPLRGLLLVSLNVAGLQPRWSLVFRRSWASLSRTAPWLAKVIAHSSLWTVLPMLELLFWALDMLWMCREAATLHCGRWLLHFSVSLLYSDRRRIRPSACCHDEQASSRRCCPSHDQAVPCQPRLRWLRWCRS